MEYDEVKRHIDTLKTAKEKIMYLQEVKTEYLQNQTTINIPSFVPSFDEKCDIEINGVREAMQLEEQLKRQPEAHTATTPNPSFKLSETGSKIDLIRVLVALHESELFEKVNGKELTKKEFMETMGDYLGVDLSNFHSNLTQALQTQPRDVNLKIFKELLKAWEGVYKKANE
jgi:hypothetical protein